MTDTVHEKKTGRAAGKRARRRDGPIVQRPWGQPVNQAARIDLLSDDELESIHRTALRILSEIGIAFHDDEARQVFRDAGASVDEESHIVRLGSEIVDEALSRAPSSFRLTPWNPDRAVVIGENRLAFTTVLGPPHCSDLERGRRSGSLEDFSDFVRLGHHFNIVHMMGGSPVEPMDVAIPQRHLESTLAMLRLTDKVPYVFCHTRRRIHDVLDMIAIAKGMTRDRLDPSTYAIINTNSPLQYDKAMAGGVMELARHNQPVLLTPFSLAGATMPVALAGAIAMSAAEMLAGLTLSQLVRPGAPFVTGAKTLNVDMKTGAPAFGSPEGNKSVQVGGQLARRYGLPFRASNFCSSNAVDFQAGMESQGTLWSAMTSGASIVMHAAGWLEGGLCASFEKFVLDVDQLQAMAAYLEPIAVNETTLAIGEIGDVGPGGHFFGTEATLAAYESAFYNPIIASTENYGAWLEAGSRDAAQRAHLIYKKSLAEYEQPVMDADRAEALEAFVRRRIAEGGAPID
jgi:trimethylamine--corrinoid protein Co-methyltransferase